MPGRHRSTGWHHALAHHCIGWMNPKRPAAQTLIEPRLLYRSVSRPLGRTLTAPNRGTPQLAVPIGVAGASAVSTPPPCKEAVWPFVFKEGDAGFVKNELIPSVLRRYLTVGDAGRAEVGKSGSDVLGSQGHVPTDRRASGSIATSLWTTVGMLTPQSTLYTKHPLSFPPSLPGRKYFVQCSGITQLIEAGSRGKSPERPSTPETPIYPTNASPLAQPPFQPVQERDTSPPPSPAETHKNRWVQIHIQASLFHFPRVAATTAGADPTSHPWRRARPPSRRLG